ncbi:MAG: hypothetical protein RMY34_07060 [Aulosira sp. DedQUE10]|nr:hypothetical protein [Aulosira sp. DedQUE10]
MDVVYFKRMNFPSSGEDNFPTWIDENLKFNAYDYMVVNTLFGFATEILYELEQLQENFKPKVHKAEISKARLIF